MTRPAVVSATAVVAESRPQWQQTPVGGRRRAKAQAAEPIAQDRAIATEVVPSVTSQQRRNDVKAATAATATTLQAADHKSEAPVAKWQHGWGELSAAEMNSRIAQLQDMGFTSIAARSALEVCDWDVNSALDCLVMHDEPAALTNSNQGNNAAKPLFFNNPHDIRKPRTSLASDSTSASGDSSSDSPLMTPQPKLTGPLLSPLTAPSVPLFPPSLADMVGPPSLAKVPLPPTTRPLTNAMGAQILNLVTGNTANGSLSVSVMPKRRLARVEHTWDCEPHSAETQMSVEEDSFVYVWSESKTAAGWIYAESLICGSRAGWLPASMLQQLPPNKCWMKVSKSCQAIYPTQLSVDLGNLVLVDVSQPPVGDGWVYAEQLGSATGCQAVDFTGMDGWVPIQCIVWAEV